jgi:hypothetical protein
MSNQETHLDKIDRGLKEAYRQLILKKRKTNSSLVIEVEGEIKEVNAWDISLEEEKVAQEEKELA